MTEPDASTAAAALAAQLWPQLQPQLAACGRPFVLGLSGLQGSGKSTLARALCRHAEAAGVAAQTLSLDDLYLGRAARRELAARVHPLLRTRGVPGTHDLALLQSTLTALASASPRHPAALPRFDKGRDTRRPPSHWPRITRPPRLLVLEGWCVGLPPQPAAALAHPLNTLEREHDVDGRWRHWVNRRLRDYQPWWRRCDALWLLQAPDWRSVCRWREAAERPLRARGAPQAMDRIAMARFMQHYERLSRHALAMLPGRADCVLTLDRRHRIRLPADPPQDAASNAE